MGQSLAFPKINGAVLEQFLTKMIWTMLKPRRQFYTTDLIAISIDDSFQILTQTELAGCIQKNHFYQCDKYHIVKNDLSKSFQGSLYLREERGVITHCKFERKSVREMAYQLPKTKYLIYSPTHQIKSH